MECQWLVSAESLCHFPKLKAQQISLQAVHDEKNDLLNRNVE